MYNTYSNKINFNLKKSVSSFCKPNEYVNAIDEGYEHEVKISTNQISTNNDKFNKDIIIGLNNITVTCNVKKGGCIVYKGNIGCRYKGEFCGEFYVKNARYDSRLNFEKVRGVPCTLTIAEYSGDSNQQTVQNIEKLLGESDFLYNISQFDDYVDLFQYYMEISNEINNTASYKIISISKPYHYIPVDSKIFNTKKIDKNFQECLNADGIIQGYKINDNDWDYLENNEKYETFEVSDVVIADGDKIIQKIKKMKESIFVSQFEKVDDKNCRALTEVVLINIKKRGEKEIVVSLQSKKHLDPMFTTYLNLYDMGQRIKVEAINNSLKLISQGSTGRATELIEYLIGDSPIPDNSSNKLPKNIFKYLEGLNIQQQQAFLKAIDCSPVTLIKGPPGTGKTHVISSIIKYIVKELKEKVIVTSQTHVAIDNCLDQIVECRDCIIPYRITNIKNRYGTEEIDATLYDLWATKLPSHIKYSEDKNLSAKILNDIKKFTGQQILKYSENNPLSTYSVIGATTTTSATGGKKGEELLKDYKWLIIDEVSKVPMPEIMRYLPFAEHIILVGDDFQLPPMFEFTKEDVEGLTCYDEEKFDKLAEMYVQSIFAKTINKARQSNRLIELRENYRSVKTILDAYNVFYEGKLINKREECVGGVHVKFNDKIYNDKNIFMIDVRNGKETIDGTSRYNVEELNATNIILKEIKKSIINPKETSIACIFPYSAQIRNFQKKNIALINEFKILFKSFDIDTVDAFQGKQSDIVILNTVVADATKRSFLSDFRRINVSLSRAKDKLFIFGNSTVLSKIEMNYNGEKRRFLGEILEKIRKNGQRIIYENGKELKYENTDTNKIELA